MAHATTDGLSPQVPGADAPNGELPEFERPPRANQPRTPPRVWPPMSSTDLGRVVRRLKVTASRLRETEGLVLTAEVAAS
jgi:hypothetical protein